MKICRIRVEYGKNETFVDSRTVEEIAISQFVEEITNKLRGKGWKKKITFRIYPAHGEKYEGQSIETWMIYRASVYTTNGFDYEYKAIPIKEKGEDYTIVKEEG